MPRVQVPEIPLRQVMWWTLGALAVTGLFWLLVRFHNVFLLLLAAIILSTSLEPLLQWLEKRGISRAGALLLILILFMLLVGLFLWLALPTVFAQGSGIGIAFEEGYTLLRDQLSRTPNVIVQRVLPILPEDLTGFFQAAGQEGDSAAEATEPGFMQQSRAVFDAAFFLIVIVLMTIYWTLDGQRIRRAAMLLVPRQHREEARTLLDEISSKIGSYLPGQMILGLSIGVLAFLAYVLIGLPNALVLAVFAGLMELVPIVGPFLGAIPAVVIALTISPATALWVVVATIIIQQLENNLLVPRVMKRTIGVNPLVTMMALIGFGSLFGILGALVALPIAAVIQLLLDRYVLMGGIEVPTSPGRDRLSLLYHEANELVGDVRNYVRHKDDQLTAESDVLEDELEAIAIELQSYLATHEQAQQ